MKKTIKALEWVDELNGDAPKEPKAEIVREPRKLSKREAQKERLADLEDELLENTLQVLGGAVLFADFDPENPEMPEGWVEKYGQKGAERMYRIAQAANKPSAQAPVAFKVAQQVGVGIIRARATEKGGPKTLNLSLTKISVPEKKFPELEIEED